MKALISILKKDCAADTSLAFIFKEYDTIYTAQKELIKKAKVLHKKKIQLPLDLMGRGIEGNLRLIKLTRALTDVIFTLPSITTCQHWHVQHLTRKYRCGFLGDKAALHLCIKLSRIMTKATEEK